jgi:C4-dicarboxylate transporter DctQ subunit
MKPLLLTFYNGLDWVNNWIERIFLTMASLSLVVIMLVVAGNALSRYFLGFSVRWSFELSEYILLYFTFLSAPYLIRVGGHATFDIFTSLARGRGLTVMTVTSLVLSFLICTMFTVAAFNLTVENYERNIILQNNLMTPRYLLLAIIPIGSALMCSELLQRLLATLLGRELPAVSSVLPTIE